MTLSRNDIETLLKAGIDIVGDLLRIVDVKNKVTYEFPLSDIGQLSIRKRLNFSAKKSSKHALIVHKWDMSRVQVNVPFTVDQELKSALKNLNIYFYTES